MNCKKLLNLVPLIGMALFIYLIIDIGIEPLINAFRTIPLQYYFLATLLFIPRIMASTYKWQQVCRAQKMEYPYFYLLKIFCISIFYGSVTPGGFGWHIRLFYLRKKKKVPIAKCLANSIIDVTLGFIMILTIALIGAIIIIDKQPGFFPIILIFSLLNTAGLIVLIKKRTGSKLFKYLVRPLIPERFREKIDNSVESLYEDIPRLRELAMPLLIEVIVLFIMGTQVFILAQAFDINVPYLNFILISAISIAFVGIIPISVGGLGVREGIFAYLLYELYAIPLEIGFALSLSGFIVKIIVPSIIGLGLSLKKDYKLS